MRTESASLVAPVVETVHKSSLHSKRYDSRLERSAVSSEERHSGDDDLDAEDAELVLTVGREPFPSPRAPEVEVKRVLRTSGLLERQRLQYTTDEKKRKLHERMARTHGSQFYGDMLPSEAAVTPFLASSIETRDLSDLLVSQSLQPKKEEVKKAKKGKPIISVFDQMALAIRAYRSQFTPDAPHTVNL